MRTVVLVRRHHDQLATVGRLDAVDREPLRHQLGSGAIRAGDHVGAVAAQAVSVAGQRLGAVKQREGMPSELRRGVGGDREGVVAAEEEDQLLVPGQRPEQVVGMSEQLAERGDASARGIDERRLVRGLEPEETHATHGRTTRRTTA